MSLLYNLTFHNYGVACWQIWDIPKVPCKSNCFQTWVHNRAPQTTLLFWKMLTLSDRFNSIVILGVTLQPYKSSLDYCAAIKMAHKPVGRWYKHESTTWTQSSFSLRLQPLRGRHVSLILLNHTVVADPRQTWSLRSKTVEGDTSLNVSDWLVKAPAMQDNGMMRSF